jgi:hypothetical protein
MSLIFPALSTTFPRVAGTCAAASAPPCGFATAGGGDVFRKLPDGPPDFAPAARFTPQAQTTLWGPR